MEGYKCGICQMFTHALVLYLLKCIKYLYEWLDAWLSIGKHIATNVWPMGGSIELIAMALNQCHFEHWSLHRDNFCLFMYQAYAMCEFTKCKQNSFVKSNKIGVHWLFDCGNAVYRLINIRPNTHTTIRIVTSTMSLYNTIWKRFHIPHNTSTFSLPCV